MAELTRAQARRIALAAQGFGRAAPAKVGSRQAGQMVDQLGQFQIDSVNVVVRAHYLPLFARLGGYDPGLLDRLGQKSPRRVFEYWGHAASLIDVRLYPALRQRMAERQAQPWDSLRLILAEHPGLADQVCRQIADEGPLSARQIGHPDNRERRPWWNWSEAKHVLEWLLASGTLLPAGRNSQFERLYELAERVVPAEFYQAPPLLGLDAWTELVRRSAKALGVASAASLADYFRISRASTNAAIQELVASGELIPTAIKGVDGPVYLWHQARMPRRISVDALVSPFDSLVFHRPRLAALFDLDDRIEIYTPVEQRVYGYYVYLFVMDDRIAARVDLKADRAGGVLLANAAWLEPDCPVEQTAARLAAALRRMADWLGLDGVRVAPIGTLAAALRRHF
ncbi:MAG: winged helix DNA-binding domain-containing protein [Propionibacteriaceae bacterium]|jgi:uncharacterized protein YcaQ|nr:winged helix DNA-binding domain-containing protein [Propionibacteriaceae bacterium]